MQIKEGAENLRKVAKDKKSVSDVNHIVKKSITKLSELQSELQELDSQLLVTQGNLPNSPLSTGESAEHISDVPAQHPDHSVVWYYREILKFHSGKDT